MLFTIALLSPPYSNLTYASPDWLTDFAWQPGLRVMIPLGKTIRVGIILGSTSAQEEFKIRSIIWPLEQKPLLSLQHIEMINQLALRQALSIGQILAHVLPVGLRLQKLRLRVFSNNQPKLLSFNQLSKLTPPELTELGTAWLQGQAEILKPQEDAASSELCTLQKDPPWPVRASASKQLAILDYLLENGSKSRRELIKHLGSDAQTALKALLKQNLISLSKVEESLAQTSLLPPPEELDFILSPEQMQALTQFIQALETGEAATHLLFGITGSGKTAVYLQLIKACLAQGKSALLLAPEVALALKLYRDAQNLGLACHFFHGYQSASYREQLFTHLAQTNQPCLVIGTRSSLFLPVPHLGLIILDEEHDSSFKQDEGLTYQAKELAWFRIAQVKGLLILGSATPDLKTYYAAQEAKIPISTLSGRVGGGTLPEIKLINLQQADLSQGLLAPPTLEALHETLDKGEQAVILLNRRGYAPLMYCLECGKVVKCPHCDIGMTYHKGRERLLCHYCGYNLHFPMPCPSCKSLHFHPMGQGTERLEESLSSLPKHPTVLRLDRDTTRRPGRLDEILEAFRRQEAQVLIGTQMLSKGHHFPEVTLAIIADGDMGLNLPDYRATERTFQLIVQASGRAGRGIKAGQVLIQTRDPNHPCWKYVQSVDYQGFYNHEIALRKLRRYPPFINLAIIRMSYPLEDSTGQATLAQVTSLLRAKNHPVTVLGPAPSPMPLINNRKRFQCLLKAKNWQDIRNLYATIAHLYSKNFRISLDLDPVNML